MCIEMNDDVSISALRSKSMCFINDQNYELTLWLDRFHSNGLAGVIAICSYKFHGTGPPALRFSLFHRTCVLSSVSPLTLYSKLPHFLLLMTTMRHGGPGSTGKKGKTAGACSQPIRDVMMKNLAQLRSPHDWHFCQRFV